MSRKQSNFTVQRYYTHDDRFDDDHSIRRVKFQNNQGGIRKNKDRVWAALRKGPNWEDDVDMADPNRRQFVYRSGQGRGRGFRDRQPHNGRRAAKGHSGQDPQNNVNKRGFWYQIKVMHGSRYSRDVILTSLANYLQPQQFFPICYQIMGQDSIFYVEKFNMAQMLLGCTRKITLADGELLHIRIKEYKPPMCPVDEAFRAKLKIAMAKRYRADKVLDLSRLVRDPEFIDGMFCSLGRPVVLLEVMKMISENVPDIVALNLTGNTIRDFTEANEHVQKLKQLKTLHLAENMITTLSALNPFKELEVAELVLERNPICQSFSERSHFVSEVRKRFPKLCKLDHVNLAPIVAFDLDDLEGKLPAPQAAYVCNAEGRDFVKAFLSQYFQLFDSENRLELAQAYADNAQFSLTGHYPIISPSDAPRLNPYLTNNRNILRVPDLPRRKQRLLTGKAEIVKALTDLPKSEHDLLSFVVDLPLFTPELISLAVCGLFRERGPGSNVNWPLRYFSRSYLIVPMGTGFCIVNELLDVTNATEEQAEVAFQTSVTLEPSISSPSTSLAPVVPAPALVIDDSIKMQMVQTIAQQTGMNLDWSKKCLEETEWDFQRAAWTFTELQKRNAIPPEAFIK